jgi:isoquinoline 1-oxidoreductase subunit alpha
MQLTINDQPVELDADPQMPLLWLLRDELNLTAHRLGCATAAAMTVNVKRS